MRRFRKLSLALCATSMLLVVGSTVAFAEPDKTIDQFWASFKAAVQKQDKQAIVSMLQFPIDMPYGIAKIRTRAQLIRRYRELFNQQANAAKCFADALPIVETGDVNRFTVACKDAAGNEVVVYGFVRTRSGWKLKYLDNLNE